ncbi:MAG TPA: hypothetical protein DEP23_06685, partial [Ruminococcaceae bacterium]|nr:hypothetical protein [Oscillospiraceae bacterium]
DAIAEEVIAGKWGNGAERKKKLKAAGYDYDAIQQLVNQKLSPKKETSKPKKETPKPAPKPAAKPAKIKVGDMISYTGRLYLTSYGILPGKKVSGKFKVDRVIEGRKYGIHIPGGWIEASKAKRK